VSGAIRIRLWGLRSECETAAQRIAAVLAVVSVSEPRADRGQSSLVRVYIEARLPDDTGSREPEGAAALTSTGSRTTAETGKGAAESRAGRGSSDAAAK
jgi:hypothetical protein